MTSDTFLRFTKWYQNVGGRDQQIPEGEVMWATQEDSGNSIYRLMRVMPIAAGPFVRGDGDDEQRWVYDEHDVYERFTFEELPDDVAAFVVAQRLLGEDDEQ